MMTRRPYEILDTFKPRRGAAHLGNFASMGEALTGDHDLVALVIGAKNEVKGAASLSIAMPIMKLFADAAPLAEKIAYFGSGPATDLPRDWNRAKTRWDAACAETLRRAWKDLGFAWVAIAYLGGNVPPSVPEARLITAKLTAGEATKFWDEATRMAIHLKVLLDRPFPSAADMVISSFKGLIPFTRDVLSSKIARFKQAALAEVEARARQGATDQFQPGMPGANLVRDAAAAGAAPAAKKAVTPLVVGAIVVGGLGLVLGAASFFKSRKRGK